MKNYTHLRQENYQQENKRENKYRSVIMLTSVSDLTMFRK